ncbi:DUF484 family protein [Pseudaquidulcibacter saccharophilus]|uniref:DUF484 family protein n=1 Tax=Pseudaquidulcibacter saccharophilus TaxID=2831900 RepID=UPI001EFF05E3|nr:DUF484 family protein [Pseudaquidulcibacter saccharophilus]
MGQFEQRALNDAIVNLDDVREYILRNPDFIRNDSEILHAIAAKPANGNLVSFEELARNRMMRETHEAKSRFAQIVETARNNYEAQMRVQEAIIAVLDSEDAEDLQDRLSGHVAFSLAADACILAISDTTYDSQSLDKIGSFVERTVPAERPVSLGALDRPRNWLYGADASDLRSEALARLQFGKSGRIGLLAIASSDLDCFRDDMGHELITFFARVVERVLTRLEEQGHI